MKKVILIFLAVTLLTACAPEATEPPPQQEAFPAQLPAAETAPPAKAPPMTFTHEKFDLGETDNPRWYEATTLELIPRDDYGELYPYPGELGYNSWRLMEYGDLLFSVYGFCTADGTIVCDPAFTTVNRQEYDGKVFYTFRRSLGHEGEEMQQNTVYLAAGDGRFVLGFDEVRSGGKDAFAVRQGERWGAVDYDGNELLPCVYEYAMSFSEGLAMVTTDFETGYEYVDRAGNTVFSMPPVSQETRERLVRYQEWMWYSYGIEEALWYLFDCAAFRSGRAVYWSPEGLCGYIDMQGEVVIPAQYTEAEGFYAGTAEVRVGDGRFSIDIYGAPVPEEEPLYENEQPGYHDADRAALLQSGDYRWVEQVGDYFIARQEMYGGLVTGDGTWIVKRYLPVGALLD